MASAGNGLNTPPRSVRRHPPRTPQNPFTTTSNVTNPGGTWGVTPQPDPTRPPPAPHSGTTRDGRVRKAAPAPPRLRPEEERGPAHDKDPDIKAQLEASGIEVFEPAELEYERSVACSNLLYRFSRPTFVVRPSNHLQVSTILTEAIARKLPLAIKNGGHSYIGSSFPNEGIMLDMKNMNEVHFDSEKQTMTIQAGALWGHVYRTLVDQPDGYMVNGGRCPTVGVSGFILGGGIGPFSRQYGMACDNVLEMTVAAAAGEIYVVTPEDNPDSEEGQLFWALCGAGGANFGVVCEFKIRVHQLKAVPRDDALHYPSKQVVAGRHTWFPSSEPNPRGLFRSMGNRADDNGNMGLLSTMNHFYTTAWPDQMTIGSSWFSDLEVKNGEIAVRFLAYFDGDQKQFNKLISRNILNAELSKQLQRRSLAEDSTRFLHETLFAQWDEEAKRSTPANSTFRIFNSFCFTNKLEDIIKITAIIKEELEAFKVLFAGEDRGLCQVTWIHSGGEMTKRSRDATAFRWRETVYHAYLMLQWRDKWLERDMRGFANKFKNRLRQYAIAGKAAFINFPDASIPKEDVTEAYYGNNRDKLAQVKRTWDPDNFFDWQQGINVAEGGDQAAHDEAEMNSKVVEEELSDADEEHPDELTDRMASDRWEQRATASYDPMLTVVDDPVQLNLLYGGEWSSLALPDLG
ncbi:hypothetical protein DHEL01_v206369 [Diaporthe helianthi]|uniref:FAD-binding PCMH-type domain-containing protein n=1 Tax=Diaporthe helianthi TaxID=158607 RepID=A0A2P5HY99_DIAHE|nr:hypothetical protein DHEL01_v206369 [Diaporthe helianthi]